MMEVMEVMEVRGSWSPGVLEAREAREATGEDSSFDYSRHMSIIVSPY
jgi:hypothetical protein